MKQVPFLAPHGLYPEEGRAGNRFEVDLEVRYPETAGHSGISGTVDYTLLFSIVQGRMRERVYLLEDLASSIAAEVKERFPIVWEIDITISKLHPPITQFQGRVSVTLSKKYDHA